MIRIAIDLNVRVRGNLTYSGYEDIEGEVPADGVVQVYEPESGIAGPGRVVEFDDEKRLVYLEVDWAALSEREQTLPMDWLGTASAGVFVLTPSTTSYSTSVQHTLRGTWPTHAPAINGSLFADALL